MDQKTFEKISQLHGCPTYNINKIFVPIFIVPDFDNLISQIPTYYFLKLNINLYKNMYFFRVQPKKF